MIFIENDGIRDVARNLALEEYVLRQLPGEGPFFLLYETDPAVVLGRHQNILEETDPVWLAANGITLARRLSGGGTVYHGRGNLNYSFIESGRSHLHDFAHFNDPVRAVLADLGIETRMQSNGSMFVGERKFSGHAQYVTANRMLSHGTLLFDADLDALNRAIRPRNSEIESRAVQSIRSTVLNLRPLLREPLDMAGFRAALSEGLSTEGSYSLSASEWEQVDELAQKYRSWQWLYGRGPRYVVQKNGHCAAGDLEVRIEVYRGRIASAEIYPSYFDHEDPAELAEQLSSLRYDQPTLRAFLANADVARYFGATPLDELLNLLY